jgi:protein TonB
MKLLLTIALATLSGCTYHDHRNYPSTTYKFDSAQEVNRPTAERTIIEAILRTQVSPALDEPLSAKSVVLPVYPPQMARANITGSVTVGFTVNHDGKVSEVQVIKPTFTPLDEVALDAVRKWQFKPATRGGEPVELKFRHTLDFTIE